MMRSVSAPAADITPPPIVSLALRSTPFKTATTRRDLSTSFRGFKTAWTAIEQVQVLSASCRRLAERAAEVLLAVREKLEEIEREEESQKGGKVVLERAYEFQGSRAGGEMAGKTIFKIQS
jgi:predicted lipoprotein